MTISETDYDDTMVGVNDNTSPSGHRGQASALLD